MEAVGRGEAGQGAMFEGHRVLRHNRILGTGQGGGEHLVKAADISRGPSLLLGR